MKTTKSSATIGLLVQTVKQDGYFHVYGYPVTIGMTQSEMRHLDDGVELSAHKEVKPDTVRNCSGSYGESQNGLKLDSLQASSQGSETSSDNTRSLYAWSIEYHCSHVDLERVKGMAKTLDTVSKRMVKTAATYGRPQTYGQFLLHFARAIGATRMVFPAKGTNGRSYNEREHRFSDLASGADTVDYMVRQWVAREDNQQ